MSEAYRFLYRPYAELLYLALKDDPFYAAMERSVDSDQPERARQAMFAYLDYSMVEAELHDALHRPSDHMYGVSIWSKPLSAETAQAKREKKQAFIAQHMGETSLKTYNNIVSYMSEQSGQYVDDNYWYLSIVGVLPEFQGRGLGVGLLSSVLAEADEQGIPTYLETFTPRNESFYERLGYQVSARIKEPSIPATYALMLRPAGG